MGISKLNCSIELLAAAASEKDTEGFALAADPVLASVRACIDKAQNTDSSSGDAIFAEELFTFRFRRIPGVTVSTAMRIRAGTNTFDIVEVDNHTGHGMYVVVTASRSAPSRG